MKVELQNGDRITIPEGCKAQINGNEVVIEKYENEFKDGDVLTLLRNNKAVFIFREDELKQKNNENGYYVGYTASYCIDVPTKGSPLFYGHRNEVRLATDEEKQFLFDKMKEQGLRWNAEEKRVEKIRWRAEDGKGYCYVGYLGSVSVEIENGHWADKIRHEFGNYFRTSEQAEEAAEVVKEALRKFHEKIGE